MRRLTGGLADWRTATATTFRIIARALCARNNPVASSISGLFAMTTIAFAAPAHAQVVAITGGTIYPVSGPKIENGTLLLRDGRIGAVGSGIAIPEGATRLDASGKWITPGLIHGGSTLGLKLFEVGAQAETQEDTASGDVKAAFNVAEGIDPASIAIPVARLEGVTSAITKPALGLIPGQAVLIDLAGDRLEDLLAKSPVAMIADLSQASKLAGGGSRARALQRFRRILRDALEYEKRREDFRKAQMQPLAASAEDLEALLPVLKGRLPLFVIANRRSDIENALRLAREFGLKIAIWGGVEAWQVAPELVRAQVPVVLEPLTNVPRFDALSARLDNATLLWKAGVKVAVAQQDQAHFRDLRQAAGNEVRNGMSWDDALRSVTLSTAEAALVADRYGSLEPGKVANVVVWSGDPFEFSSRAEHVFIRGREVPLVSRQTELLDRYRSLPPRY
jgi:imidazolonepropionase-like amidohydrolase